MFPMIGGGSSMSTSMFGGLSNSNQETYGGTSYRSVAFGTWKVGEARRFTAERFAKRHRTPDPVSRRSTYCQRDKSPPKKAAEATEAVNAVEATETVEKCPDLENQQHKPQPNNSNEQFEDKISSGPQFSKSQPCSPIPTKRQLNRQAKLAEHEAEEMANSGDCYSSTEYVQYATAATKNPYENVVIGEVNPTLRKQAFFLNRSMDALNERIVHNLVFPCYEQPGTSRNGNLRGTLGKNWRIRAPAVMPREYVVDPGPLYPLSAGSDCQKRQRAKSLDNTNRINTTTFPKKTKRTNFKQPEESSNKSALQSAKNFLRRLYNTSTLRLRGGNRIERKAKAEDRFKMAFSPFYEPRRPDVNERPFLPYNIRYEIEDEEDEGAVYDSHILSTPASSASSSATTANNSPDEGIDGMFSTGDDTASSTRSSGVSSTNGILSTRSPLQSSLYHRPGSGLSSSTMASSSGLNSTFSSSLYAADSNVYNIMSPRRQAPVLVERFRNWNELFEHLKKEMNEIRAHDNQILHDLKQVEDKVNKAKQTAAI